MNERMNRARLNVGAYILQPYAQTEKHVKEIAECSIDFITCLNAEVPGILDAFEKYGVGAILSGILPGWWGGDGDDAGKLAETNPITKYEEAAAKFVDHPAVWGLDAGDEPSALDFPYYGRVIDTVNSLFPHQFAYLNLYPNYASVAQNNAVETVNQLGTATYAEHIEKYIENVPTDYICYDYYMYSASTAGAYENLRIVSDACLRTGRSMWIVLQVNSNKPDKWISENQLRVQAYSAMAFGAESIIWACYTAGWWHNQVLDEKGEKTAQYEKLRLINKELHNLGETYMHYRRTSTQFVGFSENDSDLSMLKQKPVNSLNNGFFFDLAADGGKLVCGDMVSRNPTTDSSRALMLCNVTDTMDNAPSAHTVSFTAYGRKITLHDKNGTHVLEPDENNRYSFILETCHGALLVAE
jgi:hypothetical protein